MTCWAWITAAHRTATMPTVPAPSAAHDRAVGRRFEQRGDPAADAEADDPDAAGWAGGRREGDGGHGTSDHRALDVKVADRVLVGPAFERKRQASMQGR